jgi:hypothetical protein
MKTIAIIVALVATMAGCIAETAEPDTETSVVDTTDEQQSGVPPARPE